MQLVSHFKPGEDDDDVVVVISSYLSKYHLEFFLQVASVFVLDVCEYVCRRFCKLS